MSKAHECELAKVVEILQRIHPRGKHVTWQDASQCLLDIEQEMADLREEAGCLDDDSWIEDDEDA